MSHTISKSVEKTIPILRGGMVGMGMIFEETYAPFFLGSKKGLFDPAIGMFQVDLTGAATRTGNRTQAWCQSQGIAPDQFGNFTGQNAVKDLIASGVDFVCVASPDDQHFAAAQQALQAGKHVIIEKPSVLSLAELDQLVALAQEKKVLAKVVYHKLLDPDHKKLRTLVHDGLLSHVNNGYCTLLEPKSISSSQFASWITGRNPGTYVAVHYIKLIDFTFGGKLKSVACTGQRGLVGPQDGTTWDSTQLRLVYEYASGREAAFDIHTSWVTPDNFPGYVEQEVQFRFDNGVWNAHSRKRGVECTIEGRTPEQMKITINNHYNGKFLEPWGERSQRGYGIEVIERFTREVAYVEWGGDKTGREERLREMTTRNYNDLSADRQVVTAVQAMEAILARHAAGQANALVEVNGAAGGLALYIPGVADPEILYTGVV
jgi:D-galacturonate reductase